MTQVYQQSDVTLSDEAKVQLHALYSEVNTMLGGNVTPLPLEQEDYDTCFRRSLRTYRQYSSRAVEFKLYFLELDPATNVYPVPDEVDNVRRIRRASMSFSGSPLTLNGGGSDALLSDSTLVDSVLMTQILKPGGGAGGMGNLVGYSMFMDRLETLGKLFAKSAIQFKYTYNPITGNKLTILDHIRSKEVVMCEVSALRTIEELLSDHFSYQYLFRLVEANAKIVVGRSIIGSVVASPQGGTAVAWNGWATEGQEEIKAIENELLELGDSSADGYAPMIFG